MRRTYFLLYSAVRSGNRAVNLRSAGPGAGARGKKQSILISPSPPPSPPPPPPPPSNSPAPPGFVRLNKLLAQKGLCSRREADRYLAKGWVRLNGEAIPPDEHLVDPSLIQTLELTSQASLDQSRRATIILNKPLGIVSCQPEHENQIPAVQLLTHDRQYKPSARDRARQMDPRNLKGWGVAGRLDINSTGLLILTQSGKIAKEIIGPDSNVEKEYLVRFAKDPVKETGVASSSSSLSLPLLHKKIKLLNEGVMEAETGEFLKAVSVEQIQDNQLKFILTEGKSHHIRRMCSAVGLPALAIKRVRIGNVVLGNLPAGYWKYFSPSHNSFT